MALAENFLNTKNDLLWTMFEKKTKKHLISKLIIDKPQIAWQLPSSHRNNLPLKIAFTSSYSWFYILRGGKQNLLFLKCRNDELQWHIIASLDCVPQLLSLTFDHNTAKDAKTTKDTKLSLQMYSNMK